MLPEEAAKQIGQFYLKKNNNDYDATIIDIQQLLITKIEVINGIVNIHTCRPGLLIGPKGKNLEQLILHLDKSIKIIEERDHIFYHLMPERFCENCEYKLSECVCQKEDMTW